MSKALQRLKAIKATFDSFPTHNKVGIGISLTGLGLGVTNFHMNKARADNTQTQIEIDQKSLKALNKIHKALAEIKTNVKTN